MRTNVRSKNKHKGVIIVTVTVNLYLQLILVLNYQLHIHSYFSSPAFGHYSSVGDPDLSLVPSVFILTIDCAGVLETFICSQPGLKDRLLK